MAVSDCGDKFVAAIESEDIHALHSLLSTHGQKSLSEYCMGTKTPLHVAAAGHKFKCIDWLLQHGANPRATDGAGNSFLVELIKQGGSPHYSHAASAYLKQLLERKDLCLGIDGEEGGDVPLVCALRCSNKSAAKALLESGIDLVRHAEGDRTPLSVLLLEPQSCQHILPVSSFDRSKQGDGKEWLESMATATKGCKYLDDALDTLFRSSKVSSSESQLLLLRAAKNGSLPTIRAISRHYPKMDAYGVVEEGTSSNILHLLSESESEDIVSLLEGVLNAFPGKEDQRKALLAKNELGETAMEKLLAVKGGIVWRVVDTLERVEMAHKYGRGGGGDPFCFKVLSGSLSKKTLQEVLDRLHEDAKTVVDSQGNNLFLFVCSKSKAETGTSLTDLCKLLVSHGVDPNLQNSDGHIASELIKAKGEEGEELEAYLNGILKKRKGGNLTEPDSKKPKTVPMV